MNIQEKVHKLASEKKNNEEKNYKNVRSDKRPEFEKVDQTKNWSEEELALLSEMTKKFALIKVNILFQHENNLFRKIK